MQSILSVISFLLIINVLLLLFSVNSNAQPLNLNDSLELDKIVAKEVFKGEKGLEAYTALRPHIDTLIEKELISNITINKGSIISEEMLQVTGSTTFTLSNGIKVHYKFVGKSKNDVQFRAISYGGLSKVKDSDLPTAQLLGNIISLSGLGDCSATKMSKLLAGKTTTTHIHLSNLTESMSGVSTTKDVETLLQMIYLRFVSPRFDINAYQTFVENLDREIKERRHSINEKINDSVTATLYGQYNPRQRLFNKDFVKEMSFDKVKPLYMERFGNAADFEFFIVGDLEKRKLRPLLEKYIASIPTSDVKEVRQDNSISWLKDTIDKKITLDMEHPKSSVRMGYKNNVSYSLKNELVARFLGDILLLRFIEGLREEKRSVHAISVKADVSKRSNKEVSLQIAFDCNLDEAEQHILNINKHIENITRGVMSQTDLDKIKRKYLKERKQEEGCNSYDMQVLINYFQEDYSTDTFKNLDDLAEGITIKDMVTFTKALLKDSKSYKIVFNLDPSAKK
ncbi:insulinase family protein [Flavivirga aquimarina]|uniref:Insulinase family protein n=1 Tax=Flavivirga aquimarina TaxID=2027862 RepID=A0ABT8W5X3_9FLAO|nr:insulinase family protein [Flavivirga aquimarina]MDO5968469.1 insulinase family protein [Flavivirga aquimarina]